MRKLKYSFGFIGLLGLALCSMTSCTDYLDREPNSTVSGEEAFKNYRNFQGFIEEIYNCIPDKEKCNWCPSWNWGDDEIFNPEADDRMTHQADLGNFRAWNQTGNWLYKNNSNPTSTNPFDHSLWGHAWYCIRKCNMGLENIDKIIGTDDEKALIAGQCYFFRAWWHFELMQFFGGLPYINEVLDPTEKHAKGRLSFQECADSCAADFQRAADLLPINWDDIAVDATISGQNQLRVNKITALGYKGKALLWAGSPLMKNGAQTGAIASGKTYDYDAEYCKRAAEAFGELLNIVEVEGCQYKLAIFDTTDIYNHGGSAKKSNSYSNLFYTTKQSWALPGTTESIFQGPSGRDNNANNSNWNTSKVFGPKMANLVQHDNVIHQPTANLVEMYGMENGLPIDDPDSGFDPNYPFKNRDPRFYHDIVFDGFKYLNGTPGEGQEEYVYCQLFTDGNMRPIANGSQTGYFIQKLIPHTCNQVDLDYEWGSALHANLSYMRLADIYLMYAEAGAGAEGATYKSSNFDKTAEQAINTIRERCGAGKVAAKYVADRNKFIDEIRRERAVELSFEGFRFNDLQRWLLLTEFPYNVKYRQEFDRKESPEFFEDNDPRNAQVSNYRKEVILTRNFGTKHYWFPFPDKDIYLSKDFKQNPGW